MNEHGEYFATDQTSSSNQLAILLDNKSCANLATLCNLPFGMEVLKELHSPRRVDLGSVASATVVSTPYKLLSPTSLHQTFPGVVWT